MMTELFEKVTLEEFTRLSDISDDKLKNIHEKIGVPESDTIQGFIDQSITNNGKEGVVFTDNCIYWKSSNSSIDRKKKSSGNILLSDLQKMIFVIEKKAMFSLIKLTNIDYGSAAPFEYEICVSSTNEEFISFMNDLFYKFASGTVEDYYSQADIEKSYDRLKYESYLTGKTEIKDSDHQKVIDEESLNFRRLLTAFDNKQGNFTFYWSTASCLFSWIYLMHKKMYREGGISLAIGAAVFLFFGIIGIPLYMGAMGIVSPYLFYKRFKKIENEIESNGSDNQKRIEAYLEQGGVNSFTDKLATFGLNMLLFWLFGGFAVLYFLWQFLMN